MHETTQSLKGSTLKQERQQNLNQEAVLPMTRSVVRATCTRHESIVRIIPVAAIPSSRVLRTLAAFGVGVRKLHRTEQATPRTRTQAVDAIVKSARLPRTVTLLTGASGCGKSTHLRAARLAVAQGVVPTRLLDLGRWATESDSSSVLDAVRCSCNEALDLLNAVGLGDALLLAQDPNILSEGQSARLRIASAIATLMRSRIRSVDAPRHSVLFIDEFASVLDRATARALCLALSRLTRASTHRSISVVLATAHDDVREWLAADLVVSFGQWGEVSLESEQ